jgi:putative aldouronate transport system permease protein
MNLHLIGKPINFLSESEYFYTIVIISSVIKGTGWSSVVYVAAIAGVDQAIYEAARIDGANRWQIAFRVTLPSIASTITVLLLLAISGILGSGFDRIYMLQNPLNLVRSEVLDTFVYKVGISSRRFSYTTAVGLFRSILAVILLGGGNMLSKKLTGNGLF